MSTTEKAEQVRQEQLKDLRNLRERLLKEVEGQHMTALQSKMLSAWDAEIKRVEAIDVGQDRFSADTQDLGGVQPDLSPSEEAQKAFWDSLLAKQEWEREMRIAQHSGVELSDTVDLEAYTINLEVLDG